MKIALYQHHHELPFWHQPKQPYAIFDEKEMADYQIDYPESDRVNVDESLDWPIFIGLKDLEYPNLMAHVSFIFDSKNKIAKRPKRFWVQITTTPELFGEDGLPVMIKDGKVQVEHLWGGDNGTFSPHTFIKDFGPKDIAPKVWTYFFSKKLQQEKIKVQEEVHKAVEKVKYLSDLLKLYPD